MNWKVREKILRTRPTCESCWSRPATQLHHCLVHDSKRFHKLVTVEENLMPVCEECHIGPSARVNSLEVKMDFAKRQVEQYNLNVGTWYRFLPLKFKEHWILELEKVWVEKNWKKNIMKST